MKETIQIRSLTSGNIRSQLLQLALPIMGSSFVQMAYTFTDMAWLGRLGSKSVAAVGVVSVLMWISYSIALINKTGSEVTIGQSLGANNRDKARDYASQNTSMAIGLGAFITIILLLWPREIISVYRLNEDVLAPAISYLRIVAFSLPMAFASMAFGGIYNGAGLTSIPFRVNAIGLAINMVLDPLFIFVFSWGTVGAAWATLLSQAFVFLYFLYRLRIHDHLLGRFKFFVSPVWKLYKHILSIGLPVAMLNSLFAIINMYMGRLASTTGGHIAVTTLSTGGQVEGITWNTSQGFSSALATFVAHNYAAGKKERIFKAYRLTLLFTSVFGLVSTILFVFFGAELYSIIIPEQEAYEAGGIYLRINGYSQLFMMLEIATQGIFYGCGFTVFPAIISIFGNCLRIPLAYLLLRSGLGVEALWWAISSSSILKGITCVTGLPWLRNIIKRKAIKAQKENEIQSLHI